ncbi:hypothetical protein [Luteibacter aegosomatissinici]|uniref:hypothetical protein n=1 Tax=Luteibacter aegosomatissinici TaxID=2911539 RepID=UPI001FFB70ED|nr:hypothetical protein [Luteibacter aegosomatissinici]UPG94425.1 hypothetical protein L2Y97_21835 [Luteibacter aegosomatissinici]
MHTVKLTVLIDDPGDIDMEVRVVAPEAARAEAAAPVTTLKPRVVTPVRDIADDYTLGGYAGI